MWGNLLGVNTLVIFVPFDPFVHPFALFPFIQCLFQIRV